MRQMALFGVTVVMAVIGVASGDYEMTTICAASNEQSKPQIEGSWVVWRDKRNTTANYDVYGYDLSLSQEFIISADPAVVEDTPKVSGDFVLWVNGATTQRDIRFFQLSTKEFVSLTNFPVNDSIAQRNAAVSGDRVVYETYESSKWRLYQYNTATQVTYLVENSNYSQINPAVSGNFVVWMEDGGSGYRVYWRDLISSNPAAPVGDIGYPQNSPAISGNLAVWAEQIPDNSIDVYGRYLPNGQRFVIAQGAAEQNYPAVSGSIVVWQEKKEGRGDYDICGIDLSDGTTLTIASGTEDDKYPAISGRTVIWQRTNFYTGEDIVGAVIPLPLEVAITAPAGGAVLLAGSGIQVGWSLIGGAAPSHVDIRFSSDDGQTWRTIAETVPFGDEGYVWGSDEGVDSAVCRFQLCEAVTDTPLANAGEAFTVFSCDAELTADITGDCFVDMADFAAMAAQWLVCGNPYDAAWCTE